jgi:hypothetical protein
MRGEIGRSGPPLVDEDEAGAAVETSMPEVRHARNPVPSENELLLREKETRSCRGGVLTVRNADVYHEGSRGCRTSR